MSGSQIEDEKILGHLHAAMQLVTAAHHDNVGLSTTGAGIAPAYACLRSMMLEPRNPTMWNSLALVYLMTGQNENAQDSIERSLDLDSSIAWTWSIWGDLLAIVGNELESERAYRMAIEMGSSEPYVLHNLVSLFYERDNHPEVLQLLEQLIPQCPEDQSLWDLYTECIMRSNKLH